MKGAMTVLWVGVIGAMSFGLYQVTDAVQAREDELARLNRDLIASEEAVHVLRAEWSYLNRPERLARLAADHLALAPMTAQQIGGFETLFAVEPMAGDQLAVLGSFTVKPASAP